MGTNSRDTTGSVLCTFQLNTQMENLDVLSGNRIENIGPPSDAKGHDDVYIRDVIIQHLRA